MAQTQEEDHYGGVGNCLEYCSDRIELILIHYNPQRLSFRHRIEGESNVGTLNNRGVEGEIHAAGHPFQVG